MVTDFNPKNIEGDEKSNKDILIYFTAYETLDGVWPWHTSFDKINGYIENKNRGKYLTLVLIRKSPGEIKKYKET